MGAWFSISLSPTGGDEGTFDALQRAGVTGH